MRGHLHRNSQKRIYILGASYFVTTVTFQRYPFFVEPLLSELFISDLWYASEFKHFSLHGYVILPDHVHLLITPGNFANISVIMHNIKRNVAHNANVVMGFAPDNYLRLRQSNCHNENAISYYHRLPNWKFIEQLHNRFHRKHKKPVLAFPEFRWQHSFRDHYIRNINDYRRHLNYIYVNPLKHGLTNNPKEYQWMWCEGMKMPSDLS